MSGRREWLALGALVLVSTAFRAWAAVSVPVPWITPDEMVYGLLGRSLYLHGSLEILGGQTPFYSLLVPALVGFPLSVFGLATGLDVLQGLQALVMSLAAVPVYLWGRSLVSRGWALVAAALTVAVPGLTYAGLMMSEVLFYPLLVLAAWALAEAIARPTRLTQGLLVVAVLAVCATRVQAIVLLPVALTAAVVDGWLARSWASLRRLWPAAAVLGGTRGCLDRVPARLGLGDARRLRGDHDHVVEHRRRGEVRRLPPRLGADPLRAVPGGGAGGAPRAGGAQRGAATRACARSWPSRPR